MKKFLHSFWVLASILCIVFYSPQMAHSNQDGAPVGKTGSPGDGGSTCASCHGGGASAGADDAFEIFASDGETIYEEGETYSFTVAATSNSSNTFGFELKFFSDGLFSLILLIESSFFFIAIFEWKLDSPVLLFITSSHS